MLATLIAIIFVGCLVMAAHDKVTRNSSKRVRARATKHKK